MTELIGASCIAVNIFIFAPTANSIDCNTIDKEEQQPVEDLGLCGMTFVLE
jgi:hypothetical protein